MYSTCLFCNGALGANEVIEHFPVGRRLAFDAAKGRLWVVCRRCERWNLTPLEERWEAIEECEREFRATRRRVSTEEIGLARLPEGLELVRIGAPLRPEMAAWRYGDQFGRRRRRALLYGAGAAAAIGGVVVVKAALLGGSGFLVYQLLQNSAMLYHAQRPVGHIALDDGTRILARRANASSAVLKVIRATGQWAISFTHERPAPVPPWWHFQQRTMTSTLSGDAALRAAGILLPAINAGGARRGTVSDAVRLVEEAASQHALFANAANPRVRQWHWPRDDEGTMSLSRLPAAVRLALEMSAHEEAERRALESELHLLAAAWKDAEEIAGIADDMFLPSSVDEDLERLRLGAPGSRKHERGDSNSD